MNIWQKIKAWFASWFEEKKIEPLDATGKRLYFIAPDPRGAPGTRIYHEYFLGDRPLPNGQWGWLARVYSANSEVTEQSGSEATQDSAREAALNWAVSAKEKMRAAQ